MLTLINVVLILGTTSTAVLVSTAELRCKLVHCDVCCLYYVVLITGYKNMDCLRERLSKHKRMNAMKDSNQSI